LQQNLHFQRKRLLADLQYRWLVLVLLVVITWWKGWKSKRPAGKRHCLESPRSTCSEEWPTWGENHSMKWKFDFEPHGTVKVVLLLLPTCTTQSLIYFSFSWWFQVTPTGERINSPPHL
jgi:hypothetical protein